MPEYDAIVIGAGHNGLTAAAVMARGGMRVLCLEKNHFIGGMATTTELTRGYRFELAGSIQFPIPTEIFDDLGFGACPIYEPEVQSASIGADGEPPILLYSDPGRLLEHLSGAIGLDAVLGMAEVAAWAEAPARAIGRLDVRKPPKTLDQMMACATDESERQAIRTALFGSVMDVVDRFLPDRRKHAQVRSMLAFLAVNSTYRGPYSPGSALCLAFALASPGDATMSKVRGGIGTMSQHLAELFEMHGGELRRHVKVVDILVTDLEMPGVDGLELLCWARRKNPCAQVLFVTGHSTLNALTDALELGATDYLLKPVDQAQLITLVEDAEKRLRRWREALAGTVADRHGLQAAVKP